MKIHCKYVSVCLHFFRLLSLSFFIYGPVVSVLNWLDLIWNVGLRLHIFIMSTSVFGWRLSTSLLPASVFTSNERTANNHSRSSAVIMLSVKNGLLRYTDIKCVTWIIQLNLQSFKQQITWYTNVKQYTNNWQSMYTIYNCNSSRNDATVFLTYTLFACGTCKLNYLKALPCCYTCGPFSPLKTHRCATLFVP